MTPLTPPAASTRSASLAAPPRAAHHDLEALRRTDVSAAPLARPRRPLLPRITAALLALGALGVLYALLHPVIFPPREVRLVGVRTDATASRRLTTAAQAAGWVEADPFPVAVRPLVSGVVESLEVLDGQRVEAGKTLIGRLRNVDLENALVLAEAEVALREAEHAEAEAALHTRRALLEQRLDLRMALVSAQREREVHAAALAGAGAERAQAEAGLRSARLDLEALTTLQGAGSSGRLARERAEVRVQESEAALQVAVHAEVQARSELQRDEELLVLAREGHDDPRGLEGEVREAEAAARRAAASLVVARADLGVARRNVDFLTIHAPIDGIVLRLESVPGSVAGPEGEAWPVSDAGTGSTGRLGAMTGALVSLYDPTRLQVRVDVQLGQVGGIGEGTEVLVEADALPGRTFHAVVYRLQHEADILKNTLQIKARITDPDPLLRPEMLVRAKFVVPEPEGPEEAARVRVLVPSDVVHGDAVMVYDPTGGGRARRVPVKVIGRAGEGWTEVEGPLGAGHKVIRDAVRDGERVVPLQEEVAP